MDNISPVFITGAGGFIGGHLARRLITSENAAVRALVRNPEKAAWLKELGAEIVVGDINDDPAVLAQAMRGCRVVYHAAAWVSESGAQAEVWKVNVAGTQNILDAALAAGVQRFVQVSSCAVYGSLQKFDIDETTPRRMTGKPYGDSKAAAEESVMKAYRERKLPVVIARVSQVYGPGSQQFTIRPIELIKAGKMVLIDGGRFLCKAIYIDNLIDGLILCAKVDAAVGEAINLTENPPVSWRDFFGVYGKMFGKSSLPSLPYPVAWLAALFLETQAKLKGKKSGLTRGAVNSLRSSNSFSNRKAKTLLGWEPKISLAEGMRLTETWLREQGYLDKPHA